MKRGREVTAGSSFKKFCYEVEMNNGVCRGGYLKMECEVKEGFCF